MKSTHKNPNESLIKEIANALGEINNDIVYVGGSVISFYADDPAAEEIRPTKDIDVFLEIVSYAKLVKLQENLATKGFYPDPEHGIMCRFRYKDILVDIMATKEIGWASADKWFEPGMKRLEHVNLEDVTIKILHISYFLATKFNAFHDRKEDARQSRHFEDIVFVFDNSKNLAEEIINAPDDVKKFLVEEFREILKGSYDEAILGHLNYRTQNERLSLIKEKLIAVIKEEP